MRILLLSAYDAASHRKWREGLVRHLDDFSWTVLTLPPRHFAWRSRGNALSWVFGEIETLSGKFDLIIATSMTDLSSLRGLHPALSTIPTVAYFHENQFAYPERTMRKEYMNYKLTNLYTALAADRILFNSRYNRDTFLEGVRILLSLMPDCVPGAVVETIEDRSTVLPVPLDDVSFIRGTENRSSGPVSMLWNHRWEHDKAPDRFFTALGKLAQVDIPFVVQVLGQRFREIPPAFRQAKENLGTRIGTFGFVEDPVHYRRILSESDLVVSTALHDFQGLAVLEAAAAGCLPVVPDRLAYREFFPEEFRYQSCPDDPDMEMEGLVNRLAVLCRDPERTRSIPAPDLRHLSWELLGPKYKKTLEKTATG